MRMSCMCAPTDLWHALCRQQELAPPSEEGPKLSVEAVKGSLAKSVEAWQLYRSQEVFPAALALALLYLTVMNFVSLLCHPQLMIFQVLADIVGMARVSVLHTLVSKLSGLIIGRHSTARGPFPSNLCLQHGSIGVKDVRMLISAFLLSSLSVWGRGGERTF